MTRQVGKLRRTRPLPCGKRNCLCALGYSFSHEILPEEAKAAKKLDVNSLIPSYEIVFCPSRYQQLIAPSLQRLASLPHLVSADRKRDAPIKIGGA